MLRAFVVLTMVAVQYGYSSIRQIHPSEDDGFWEIVWKMEEPRPILSLVGTDGTCGPITAHDGVHEYYLGNGIDCIGIDDHIATHPPFGDGVVFRHNGVTCPHRIAVGTDFILGLVEVEPE